MVVLPPAPLHNWGVVLGFDVLSGTMGGKGGMFDAFLGIDCDAFLGTLMVSSAPSS